MVKFRNFLVFVLVAVQLQCKRSLPSKID